MSEGEAQEARVIGVDSDDADDLIGALSSDTARDILAELHDEPATPSDVADRADTTVQNARYHLENLSDAGLIDVDGTRYSEKGREMDVYAPSEPLVMFVGTEEDSTTVRDALTRFLGIVGIIGVASVFVQTLFRLYAPDAPADAEPRGSGGDDMGAFDVEEEAQQDAAEAANQTADGAADAAPALIDRVADLPPGLVFFVAATTVAVVAFGVWYVRERRK
ncbi:MAG: ArsR/SmtB family transcription factor [Halobacteriales archaeon]